MTMPRWPKRSISIADVSPSCRVGKTGRLGGDHGNLGNALKALGGRESGTARLKEAVTAYRETLHEYTRARAPLEWARTQMNLGVALARLGERESGRARLEEAVAAFREALQEYTRARAPLEWARTR